MSGTLQEISVRLRAFWKRFSLTGHHAPYITPAEKSSRLREQKL